MARSKTVLEENCHRHLLDRTDNDCRARPHAAVPRPSPPPCAPEPTGTRTGTSGFARARQRSGARRGVSGRSASPASWSPYRTAHDGHPPLGHGGSRRPFGAARSQNDRQAGKGLAGLDEHQVRRWTSWRRWTLLAMLAHALLVVIAANEHTDRLAPTGMIPLTCAEIRRLLTVLVTAPSRVPVCPRAWSTWRRRHQHRARSSHYKRQEAPRRRS